MKILIYVSSLTAGGAEKVASLMANYWAENHHVILLTDSDPKNDFFEISPSVHRQSTGFKITPTNPINKILMHLKGLIQLRSVVKKAKPDVIISHMDVANVRMLMATAGMGIPVIIEEHNNPKIARKLPQPWSFFQPFVYRKLAKAIVLLTKDLLVSYDKELYKKIVFIPNPLNIPNNIPENNQITLKNPTFVSMGSLRDIKGFDLLIQAFSLITKSLPDWSLTILGEGNGASNVRNKLEKLIAELHLQNRVYLPGRVQDPYGVIKNADIYVLSSRSEAFPVALCEAMGVGLPCISFDCPTGPADIIEDNLNGILVEYLNVNALAQTMLELANNPQLREQLSNEAVKINETLHLNTIMSQWEEVIENVTN